MSDVSLVVNNASSQLNEEWRLPFDVVSDIMAISRGPTISSIMQTCRTLYTEGPKHILRDGVELSSADETDTFTTFMLAEGPSRFAHLRKLALFMDAHHGAHLVRLLSHPSLALEDLVLHQAEICLGPFANSALCAAIRGLKTVKHLVLFEVEEEHTSLSCLPRALAHISIHAKCGVGDTLRMLRPLSDTLRTLLINSEPQFSNRFRRMDLPPCHFPHVQTFGIVYNEFSSDILSSPAFSQAFPAIIHLQLIPMDPPTARRRTPHPQGRSRLRHRTHTLDRHTPPSWPSLAECSGGLHNVHSLGLPCTLSTLRLWQAVEADELRVLRGVLERTRPRRLCLSTELDDVEPLFATLHGLHEPPERVDVKIFVPKEATAKLFSVLEALLQEIPTGLVELNLHFDIPSVYWPAEKSEIRDTLAGFAHRASIAAPSLRLTCRLSERGDDGQWQWPDLHRVTAYHDRDSAFKRDPEDDRYPFGDGEGYLIREARSRHSTLRSELGF